MIDRKKELIITSSGKNIAPSNIENHLKESPLVGHALAFGDDRPYVVAILTLDPEIASIVAGTARDSRHRPGRAGAGTRDPGRRCSRSSTPPTPACPARSRSKRWTLLPIEWTAETAELTPTLKLRRRVVHGMYADEIDALYA